MTYAHMLVFQFLLCIVSPQVFAQPATVFRFEVSSVRAADPDIRGANVLLGAGESLNITNVPLRKIITYAYDLRDFQLAGGPGWISDQRYDIAAKTAATEITAADPASETDDQRRDRVSRVRERLRSLLADRFGLRIHEEERENTILTLSVAKGGAKFAEAAVKPGDSGRVSIVDGRIQGYGVPISMLVPQLSSATGLIVHDETALGGKYDFTLEWAPEGNDPGDPLPSIYTAVVEQLGLRLERAKALVKFIVIDDVKPPSAN